MHKACNGVEEMSYCFSRSPVIFQGRTGQKIVNFDPNWAFPDCNSRFYSPMATKLCTNLKSDRTGALLIFEVICQSFMVTWGEKLTIWLWFQCFRLVILLKIIGWLRNNTYSFQVQGRGALLFFRHPSNFFITPSKKLTIWMQFGQDY